MTEGDRREHLHQRVWDLLPWYVNGTLPEGERRTVETHLTACPRCQEEARACRELGEAIRQEEIAPVPHPARLARLMERIDAAPTAPGGWRQALLAPWHALAAVLQATPPPARAALGVQLVVLVALAGLALHRPELPEAAPPTAPIYQTLSEDRPAPAAATRRLRLVFAEGATEREVRDLLLRARGQIVAGPSALGVYTVEVPAAPDPLEEVLLHLRAEPQVSLAEPAVGP